MGASTTQATGATEQHYHDGIDAAGRGNDGVHKCIAVQ
jgi:hypothetical protein